MERAQRLLSLPASPATPHPCRHQLGDTLGTLSSPEQGQSPSQRGLHSFALADLPAALESHRRLMISCGASTEGLALKGQGRGREYNHGIFHGANLDSDGQGSK